MSKGWIIYFSFCLILGLLSIGIAIYNDNYNPIIPCLESIAKDYCEEEGLSFGNVDWVSHLCYSFSCEKKDRSFDMISYKFFPEEIERCKKK